MNEKALEAGWRALSADLDQQWPLPLDEDGWMAKGGSLDMKQAAIATIEAYLAALPDEGDLVKRLRRIAKAEVELIYWPGLLNDVADGLEAARAKIEDVQGLAYRQAEKLHEVSHTPEGWRLVPEKPTEEWVRRMTDEEHPEDVAFCRSDAGCIELVLAAAPEISDD